MCCGSISADLAPQPPISLAPAACGSSKGRKTNWAPGRVRVLKSYGAKLERGAVVPCSFCELFYIEESGLPNCRRLGPRMRSGAPSGFPVREIQASQERRARLTVSIAPVD